MTRFLYKAVSPEGEVLEGEIEAASRQAVVDRLHAQGHVPIRAEPSAGRSATRLSLPRLSRSRRITRKDVVLFTREMATLLQAGLPLDRAMTVLAAISQPGPMRSLVEEVQEKVRGGATLADAMEQHPGAFPNFYCGMVRAGEAGGTLETVLERLAVGLERAQALRETVRSGLQYPALVVVMAVLSLVVLMTAVIPEFRPLFEDAGAALPLSTRIVIGASDFVAAYWWAMGLGLLALALGIRQHNRDPAGRLRWDRMLWRLPLAGELIMKVEAARFSRTLGTLLANGVSVLSALTMTTETLGNRAIAEAVGRARGRLAKGERLADPLMETGAFPGLALQLIQVGEETGQLETMLLRIADIYDEEVKHSIQRLLALLVPLVTIVLGILIAVIIGSMLAAILSSYDLPL
ncbi:MAG: type II secretion system F family protein [Kiloniellales bacterium]|jgi:general secretion pathway protein F